MEQLKNLAKQIDHLQRAVQRQIDLIETGQGSDAKLGQVIEQLVAQVQQSFDELKNAVRITPEQVSADENFRSALEASLKGWRIELEQNQKEQVDQAINDVADAGQRSEKYFALEAREKELKTLIAEAEQKLGKVTERISSPSFSNTVHKIVNNAKR